MGGKILFDNKPDIFEDCLRSYSDVLGNGNRSFPLNRIVLLYAIITYLLNKNSVSEDQFRRRLRSVHNLVRNSEYEISDSETRTAGNRMPAILRQVDSIIINGAIDEKETPNFNNYQLEEEKTKLVWTEEHPELAESLYKVEDNSILRGQIAILGLDKPELFDKFEKLFTCSWDLVDCALLSTGDYKQCERNNWRQQLGSKSVEKAWITLFHRSANSGFERTKETLIKLLESLEDINDDSLRNIVDAYIADCEAKSLFEWRYYYVKYNVFRPGRYGKYSWRGLENGYYNMHALWTESQWSENSYQPFLYAADPSIISRDDLGHVSIKDGKKIECRNSGYFFIDIETEEEVDRIDIKQTEDGIDQEDRIIVLKNYLK